jgi:hypothetical protein
MPIAADLSRISFISNPIPSRNRFVLLALRDATFVSLYGNAVHIMDRAISSFCAE